MSTEIETSYISPMFAVDAKSAVEVHVADVYAENGHRYSHRGYRTVILAPVFNLHQVEEAADRWSNRRDGFETDYVAPVFDREDVSVRTVTVKITTAADVSEDDLHRGRQVAAKVTLKDGEQITSTSIKDVTKYTVKAVAPKGASKTKHFVTIPGMTIPEWDNGHDSQSAARSAAIAYTERTGRPCEVISITRREDGQPLVQVARTATKRVYEATVAIAKSKTGKVSGWVVSSPFHF